MPKPKQSKIGGSGAPARRSDEAALGSRKGETLWPGLILMLIGLLVYANSFQGVMLFDDIDAIILNSSIQKPWPISEVLNPPAQSPMAGRPVVNLTLAFNYALGGLEPRGYHAVNLAIHLAAGLVLWGLLRRIWPKAPGGRGDARVTWLATIVALIWIVHPLQTESVTYIVQRAEALAGLFYLLTLYCAARGIQAAERGATKWFVAAVIACALGMATKENMATAPLMTLLLDYVFFSRSIRETLRRRWGLYAALAATWLILAELMAGGPRSDSAGFGLESMGIWDYAGSQPLVVLHYLRLAVCPYPLCLDYGWPVVKSLPAVVIPTAVLTAAFAASLWALRWRPVLGFLGVCFFVVLAPTSSFVPLKDLAFEHRMYLPLVAVIVPVVVVGERLLNRLLSLFSMAEGRWSWARGLVAALVVAVLCGLTIRRNVDYYDAVGMWRDAAAKRPNNARAFVSLGMTLGMAGRPAEAMDAYHHALQVDPTQRTARVNLGNMLSRQGRYQDAVDEYQRALEADPNDAKARYALGLALAALGRFDDALACQRGVLQIEPGNLYARFGVAVCLQQKGDVQAAAEAYRMVVAGDPANMPARCNLAICLLQTGRREEAIAECRSGLQVNPRHGPLFSILGNALASTGQLQEALDAYIQAVSLDPTDVDARCSMGTALAALGRTDEAIACHRETLQRSPRHVATRLDLARLLEQQGRLTDAATEYSEVLRIDFGNAAARAASDRLQTRPGTGRP
jgi:tetratricopeptide (TPR) repeat protein